MFAILTQVVTVLSLALSTLRGYCGLPLSLLGHFRKTLPAPSNVTTTGGSSTTTSSPLSTVATPTSLPSVRGTDLASHTSTPPAIATPGPYDLVLIGQTGALHSNTDPSAVISSILLVSALVALLYLRCFRGVLRKLFIICQDAGNGYLSAQYRKQRALLDEAHAALEARRALSDESDAKLGRLDARVKQLEEQVSKVAEHAHLLGVTNERLLNEQAPQLRQIESLENVIKVTEIIRREDKRRILRENAKEMEQLWRKLEVEQDRHQTTRERREGDAFRKGKTIAELRTEVRLLQERNTLLEQGTGSRLRRSTLGATRSQAKDLRDEVEAEKRKSQATEAKLIEAQNTSMGMEKAHQDNISLLQQEIDAGKLVIEELKRAAEERAHREEQDREIELRDLYRKVEAQEETRVSEQNRAEETVARLAAKHQEEVLGLTSQLQEMKYAATESAKDAATTHASATEAREQVARLTGQLEDAAAAAGLVEGLKQTVATLESSLRKADSDAQESASGMAQIQEQLEEAKKQLEEQSASDNSEALDMSGITSHDMTPELVQQLSDCQQALSQAQAELIAAHSSHGQALDALRLDASREHEARMEELLDQARREHSIEVERLNAEIASSRVEDSGLASQLTEMQGQFSLLRHQLERSQREVTRKEEAHAQAVSQAQEETGLLMEQVRAEARQSRSNDITIIKKLRKQRHDDILELRDLRERVGMPKDDDKSKAAPKRNADGTVSLAAPPPGGYTVPPFATDPTTIQDSALPTSEATPDASVDYLERIIEDEELWQMMYDAIEERDAIIGPR